MTIENNTTKLQSLLEQANALPDDSSEQIAKLLEYGYCGSAINLGAITDEAGLTTAIASIYDNTASIETKMLYWQGYPATGTNGWFGILTRSSSNNGSVLAWAAFDGGLAIQKTKRSGSWLPVTYIKTVAERNADYPDFTSYWRWE